MVRVCTPRIGLHVLPGRCNKQARKILANKCGTARLPCRHAQAAQMFALRAVDIDASAAPARIPDQAIGIDHRAVDAAAVPSADQRRGRAARQTRRRIEIDAEEHVFVRIGEVADSSIR